MVVRVHARCKNAAAEQYVDSRHGGRAIGASRVSSPLTTFRTVSSFPSIPDNRFSRMGEIAGASEATG